MWKGRSQKGKGTGGQETISAAPTMEPQSCWSVSTQGLAISTKQEGLSATVALEHLPSRDWRRNYETLGQAAGKITLAWLAHKRVAAMAVIITVVRGVVISSRALVELNPLSWA